MNRSHLFLACCIFASAGLVVFAQQKEPEKKPDPPKVEQTKPVPPPSNVIPPRPVNQPALPPGPPAGTSTPRKPFVIQENAAPPHIHGKCVGVSTSVSRLGEIRVYRAWEDGHVEYTIGTRDWRPVGSDKANSR